MKAKDRPMSGRNFTPQIVDEDNHILVVVKPANLLSQADASGDADLLSLLKEHIRQRDHKPGNVFLGLVHRLDRPTVGLMVFAKTGKAAARLARAQQEGRFNKEYCAVVRGGLPVESDVNPGGWSRWEDWLCKEKSSNMVRVVSPDFPGARSAALLCKAEGRAGELGLIRLRLLSGRSHQIRVQAAARGFPLWGDQRYDPANNLPGMQLALIACELAFPHPVRDRVCRYTLPLPLGEPWKRFTRDLD